MNIFFTQREVVNPESRNLHIEPYKTIRNSLYENSLRSKLAHRASLEYLKLKNRDARDEFVQEVKSILLFALAFVPYRSWALI